MKLNQPRKPIKVIFVPKIRFPKKKFYHEFMACNDNISRVT